MEPMNLTVQWTVGSVCVLVFTPDALEGSLSRVTHTDKQHCPQTDKKEL